MRRLVFCFLVAGGAVSSAQAMHLEADTLHRYVVRFADKSDTTYSIGRPEVFLSQRALDRRVRRGIQVTERDLPPVPAYIQGLRALGIEVYFRSRWLNAALVQCTSEQATRAAQLSYVTSVTFVAPRERLFPRSSKKPYVSRSKPLIEDSLSTPLNHFQNSILGLDEAHQMGLDGRGILIAVTDAGYSSVDTSSYFYTLYQEQRIVDVYDFVTNTEDVYARGTHGTAVLSTMAAEKMGEYIGTAVGAKYALYVTEDSKSEHRVEEYNWVLAAERADSIGADIIHTSLGYKDFDIDSMDYSPGQLDGSYALISRAARWASERGMLVVAAMGNEGMNGLGAPADAPSVLSVAALDFMGKRTDFSSIGVRGPPHTKPDVAALGLFTVCVSAEGLVAESGTSLAAPLVSGLIATLWSIFPWATASEMRELLRSSADQSDQPDHLRGYGLPHFGRATVIMAKTLRWEADSLLFEESKHPLYGSDLIRFEAPDTLAHVQPQIRILDLEEQRSWPLSPLPRPLERLFLIDRLSPGTYTLEVTLSDLKATSSIRSTRQIVVH